MKQEKIDDLAQQFIDELRELLDKYHAWIEVGTYHQEFEDISIETWEKTLFKTDSQIISSENLISKQKSDDQAQA